MRTRERFRAADQAPSTARTGYSSLQIGVHWLTVALVIVQLSASEGMEAAYDAEHGGASPTAFEWFLADVHVAVGVTIFLLTLFRFALRIWRRVPPLPEHGHPALGQIARAVHLAFYVVLILLPVTGALAWFGDIGAMAEIHEALQSLLLPLVALHVAGTLYHHVVRRTNLLRRMLRPQP